MHDCNDDTQFYYDRNTAYPKYTVGQKVLLYDPVTKKGDCKKLKRRWLGPFHIVSEGDGCVYKLRKCDDGQEMRAYVHSNRLRPFNESRDMYYARNPPSTVTDTTTTQAPATARNDTTTSTTDLGDGWYEIDKITNRRMIAGKPHFLVHWKEAGRSYEPDRNISDYAKAQYYASPPARRKPKRRTQ